MTIFSRERTPLYLKAVRAIEELYRDEGATQAEFAYAEAVADLQQADFIESLGARRVKHKLHICLRRLQGKRCSGNFDKCSAHAHIPQADHLSEWRIAGKTAVILSQPYNLTTDSIRATAALCDRYDLEVFIHTWPSFHFPGAVLSVEFYPADGVRARLPWRGRQ